MTQPRKYECASCGGSVSKNPLVKPPKETKVGKDGKEKQGKAKYEQVGLHGWSCNNCGRGVKVKVTLLRSENE